MFHAKTIEVGETPVELTDGMQLNRRSKIRISFTSGNAIAVGADGSVAYGAGNVGYRLNPGSLLEFSCGEAPVWAVCSSQSVGVGVLVWTE